MRLSNNRLRTTFIINKIDLQGIQHIYKSVASRSQYITPPPAFFRNFARFTIFSLYKYVLLRSFKNTVKKNYWPHALL